MKVLTGVRPQGELRELAEAFGADWLSSRVQLSPKQLLTEIIRLPQDAADRAIAGLVTAAQKLMTQDGVSATVSDAANLVNLVAQKYPGDKGATRRVCDEPDEPCAGGLCFYPGWSGSCICFWYGD